jgi:hypothetical protein
MHCIRAMSDSSEPSSSAAMEQPAGASEASAATVTESRKHWPDRLVRFGREHPALTIAGLAGAGLFGGLEMAAGIVLGAGVAALVRRPNGHSTAEPAREIRGRMRQMLDRAPHELKERARAVLLAARGKITAPPGAEHEAPAPVHEAPAPRPEATATQGAPA